MRDPYSTQNRSDFPWSQAIPNVDWVRRRVSAWALNPARISGMRYLSRLDVAALEQLTTALTGAEPVLAPARRHGGAGERTLAQGRAGSISARPILRPILG
jgi:hypothetical protein